MTHTKSHVCRLAAGAFKRDPIPESVGTVKNPFCLENLDYILKIEVYKLYLISDTQTS
jgi:hypothetical protein